MNHHAIQSEPVGRPGVDELLALWNRGESHAAVDLMPLLYDELHRIAQRLFNRERRNHTLQATAVVHEAYMELLKARGVVFHSRGDFLGFATHLMRRILVRHSRQHLASKRGGWAEKVCLDDTLIRADGRPDEVLALDSALTDLAKQDPEKAKIVELRVFGGLTISETADHLGMSTSTVNRQWRQAITWLYRDLKPANEYEQPLAAS